MIRLGWSSPPARFLLPYRRFASAPPRLFRGLMYMCFTLNLIDEGHHKNSKRTLGLFSMMMDHKGPSGQCGRRGSFFPDSCEALDGGAQAGGGRGTPGDVAGLVSAWPRVGAHFHGGCRWVGAASHSLRRLALAPGHSAGIATQFCLQHAAAELNLELLCFPSPSNRARCWTAIRTRDV